MPFSADVMNAITSAMQKHGMPREALPWVLAIAEGESGGNPKETRETDNADLRARGIAAQPEASYGLFQLNVMGGRGSGYTKEQLYDPYLNADINMPALVKTWNELGGIQTAQSDPIGFLQTFYQRGQGSIPQDRQRAEQLWAAVQGPGVNGREPTADGVQYPDNPSAAALQKPPANRMPGADYNRMLQQTKQAAEDIIARFNRGDPDVLWEDVQGALATYWDSVAMVRNLEIDDSAQQDFENAINLGDFKARQADRAYQTYADKRDAAKGAAEVQIAEADARNRANADVQSAFTANSGQGPVAGTRTYLAPRYEDAIAKWNREFNVGDEPSRNPDDYPGPALPQHGTRPAAGGDTQMPLQTQGNQRVVEGTGGLPPNLGGTYLDTSRWKDLVVPLEEEYGKPRDQTAQERKRADIWRALGGRTSENNVPTFFGREMSRENWPITMAVGDAVADTTSSYFDQARAFGEFIKPSAKAAGKKAKKWWQKRPGILKFADGTDYAPGGKAMVGEQGEETMVTPDGRVVPIGAYGPEVMDVPEGSMIAPHGVPPDEAFAYSQVLKALRQGGDDRAGQMLAQQERANDPQLQQKVEEALRQAVASTAAAHPPTTPVLRGQWGRYSDPWADWRPLSGVPATEQEMMAAQGGQR